MGGAKEHRPANGKEKIWAQLEHHHEAAAGKKGEKFFVSVTEENKREKTSSQKKCLFYTTRLWTHRHSGKEKSESFRRSNPTSLGRVLIVEQREERSKWFYQFSFDFI